MGSGVSAGPEDVEDSEDEEGSETFYGSLDGSGLRIGIVVARFNELVTRPLLAGARETLSRHWVDVDNDVDVAWVPGSFELPVVAKAMAKSGKYDAVIAIGVVVKGATAHYDAVVGATTSGVLNAAIDTGVPVVFNVLTCDSMDQALDRAGGKVGNKGSEAAATAVEMANLLASMREVGSAAPTW
ncbi:6,7-dimethyl-8-ribityllumazine synthase [Auxenochlorella protothecoides]|uniref:6,7-dimethyl-8-ribityllumazine synthase n=1 Tax=Auxenochlorella protothecoides TaxID=3075 RepID=A0A087SN50_AUXPR|nr:6,7-dimethyl-8-ribityllumazine synthase [Auxenochlorella protothecoides]KFM27154.1 6,7-dimethyl-8-ribityllumazine synthase [Auxenochlorella protothecoides]